MKYLIFLTIILIASCKKDNPTSPTPPKTPTTDTVYSWEQWQFIPRAYDISSHSYTRPGWGVAPNINNYYQALVSTIYIYAQWLPSHSEWTLMPCLAYGDTLYTYLNGVSYSTYNNQATQIVVWDSTLFPQGHGGYIELKAVITNP